MGSKGRLPRPSWHQYEPCRSDTALRGTDLAFGEPVNTYYDFTKADVVVSLDADFLSCGPGKLAHVRRLHVQAARAHQRPRRKATDESAVRGRDAW